MSIEVTTTVELTLECAICGKLVDADKAPRNQERILVTPCETCLKNARDEGYGEGCDDNEQLHEVRP